MNFKKTLSITYNATQVFTIFYLNQVLKLEIYFGRHLLIFHLKAI